MVEIRNILIVEDDPVILNLTKIMLGQLGYGVAATASCGREAISKTVENSPDFVLMDINLGTDFDGIDTATYIYHCLKTPVIFLTGNVDSAIIQRAKYAEPFGYLTKPFTKDNLYSTIEIALNNYNIALAANEAKKPNLRSLAHLNDPLFLVDREARILFANPCAEYLSGMSLEKSFLKPVNEVLGFWHPQKGVCYDHAMMMHYIHNGAIGGRKQDVILLSKENKKRKATMQVTDSQDKKNNYVGYFLQLHQIFTGDIS